MLNKVKVVAFPLSDLNTLVCCLLDYFGEQPIGYWNHGNIGGHRHAGPFFYCEKYTTGCKMPCPKHKTPFQKDHDFGLKSPIQANVPVIVMAGNPHRLMVDYFKYQVSEGKYMNHGRDWYRYVKDQLPFINKWFEKWVLSPLPKGSIVIFQEDMYEHPVRVLTSVIGRLSKRQVDMKKVHAIARKRLLFRHLPPLTNFKHYSKHFFDNFIVVGEAI